MNVFQNYKNYVSIIIEFLFYLKPVPKFSNSVSKNIESFENMFAKGINSPVSGLIG